MPWNAPIGLPNCWRVFACSTERASAAPATPTRSAAAATSGVASADSRSTGAMATGSASTSTSATGWAGSVHSAPPHGHAIADAHDGDDRPVGRRGQGDDQFGAGEAGHRDGASLHASVLQRHRDAGQAIARRMNSQRGDDATADLGQHISDGGTGRTQQTRGQADAGQQRDGRQGRTTFLEDNAQVHRPNGLSPSAPGPASSVQPRSTTVFHTVRQRSGIRHGLPSDCRRAFGAQDVTHAVAQRQLSEFSPTSIRPLT